MKKYLKTLNVIAIALFFAFFIWGMVKTWNDHVKRITTHKYTIGVVNHWRNTRGDPQIKIQFNYNNIIFIDEVSTEGWEDIKQGDRFYIQFYPENPYNFAVIFDQKIVDSTIVIPPMGWDSLPTNILSVPVRRNLSN